MAAKKIYDAIYALVNTLAGKYGFNCDEAIEVLTTSTDVDHIKNLTSLLKAPKATASPKKEEAPAPVAEEPKKRGRKPSPKKEEAPAPVADEPKKRGRKPSPKKEEAPAPVADEPKKRGRKPSPKKEEAPATVADEPKKEKRIPRMTNDLKNKLKTALSNVGLEIEIDQSLTNEFKQYIENIDDETWKTTPNIIDHIRHFAESKAPAPAVEQKEVLQTVTETHEVQDVTLENLQKIELLTVISNNPGVFWDGDNGRFVTGPAEDEDEDFNEVTFESVKYVVGEKTGRVHEARDDKDVFVGFKGVGKFAKLNA